MADQIYRSGASISANVHEGQHAESRRDFIHKMKIAAKEANETKHWLILSNRVKSHLPCEELLKEIESILKIFIKDIIHRSKKSLV